jgi:hypothetical protein
VRALGAPWRASEPTAPDPALIAEVEAREPADVARLVARAALRREESRGGHYRDDLKEAFVTEITPSPRTSRAGTSTSSGAPSWPTTRPSRAAW